MAQATIVLGVSLCAATLVALLNIDAGRVTTAFIPLVFGVPIFICGVFSLNPHRARTWLRVAVMVATVGAIGSIFRMGVFVENWIDGDSLRPMSIVLTIILSVALIAYSAIVHRLLKRRVV